LLLPATFRSQWIDAEFNRRGFHATPMSFHGFTDLFSTVTAIELILLVSFFSCARIARLPSGFEF
jgi:hypothetical protein